MCPDFVCEYSTTCMYEPICELHRCPKYVLHYKNLCEMCLSKRACRTDRKARETRKPKEAKATK